VEEKFVRTAAVMELVIQGQAIKTTAEHPFYVPAQERFVPAGELQVGDQLVSSQGVLVPIESISNLNEITTVYNLRVADHHTYFVGGALWGWDVWVHNAYKIDSDGIPRVVSQHYSESTHGIRLQLQARRIRARLTERQGKDAMSARNLAVADIEIDGVIRTKSFINVPKSKGQPDGIHSEHRLIEYVDQMRAKGHQVKVTRVFTERKPCGSGSVDCAANLYSAFGAEIEVFHQLERGLIK
jgi:hypothetical protein